MVLNCKMEFHWYAQTMKQSFDLLTLKNRRMDILQLISSDAILSLMDLRTLSPSLSQNFIALFLNLIIGKLTAIDFYDRRV